MSLFGGCVITQQNVIILTDMSYFKKNNRKDSAHGNSQCQSQAQEGPRQQKKRGDSRHSYLKAFKKYYIDKLIQEKCENRNTENRLDRENFQIHDAKPHPDKENRQDREREKEKTSTMTDSTSNSRAKTSFGKISQSKIANLVKNNDSELEALIYGSITEVEREVARIGDLNDLAKENKLLRCSISSLRGVLREKLEVALKKNKEELTTMFEEYSQMIKKLLEDKETLTNALSRAKDSTADLERRLQETHATQMRLVVEENQAQAAKTKQQVEEFLEVIEQYEEEAERERVELENLRERLVELEMENDQLKTHDSLQSTKKITTQYINERCEKQLEKYAEKIEALLEMLEEAQAENKELNQFLKSCRCSRIDSLQTADSRHTAASLQEVVARYERQLVEAEKEHVKGEAMLRQALTRKDECIERLNLIIHEIRASRYASVDRITEQELEKQISLQNST